MEEQFISPTEEEDERPWAARAECRGEDPALFFPGPDDDTSAALSICARCPVRRECLEYAIEARERFGIWGGTTERQRRRMVRRSA
jgi:WhiB family redox-sensing transcriptional regulator